MKQIFYILVCLMIPMTAPVMITESNSGGDPDIGEFVSIIPHAADSIDIEFALYRRPTMRTKQAIDYDYYYSVMGVSNLTSKGTPVIVQLLQFQLLIIEPGTGNIARIPSIYQNSINVTVLDTPTQVYTFGEKSANVRVAMVTWSNIQLRIQ